MTGFTDVLGAQVQTRQKTAALELGKFYELDGQAHECVLSNECRALLRPTRAVVTTFFDPSTGINKTVRARAAVEVSLSSLLKESRRDLA